MRVGVGPRRVFKRFEGREIDQFPAPADPERAAMLDEWFERRGVDLVAAESAEELCGALGLGEQVRDALASAFVARGVDVLDI